MSSTKNPEHHHHHNVVYKKPNHRYNLNQRDDSDDEIDVFEATKYFAAGACSHIHQKSMLNYKNNITDDQPVGGRRSRISLDTSSPFRSNQSFSSSQSHQKQTKHQKPKSKYKQEPVSPGGKLVSFLNSLFNQTSSSSSKKKKSSTPSNNIKDEDQRSHHDFGYAAGRRKRRSSISHFPSFNNKISTAVVSISDMKSSPPYPSSLTSGFRTPPPPYSTKAAKMYQTSSSDPVITTSKQQLNNLSMHSGRGGSSISLQDQKMINRDMETIDVLYEKYKKINSLSNKKDKDGMMMRIRIIDDGGESDSSSDLFELQNYDLCSEYCSVSGERDGVDYR